MSRLKYEYRISISKRDLESGRLLQVDNIDFDVFYPKLLVCYKNKSKISTLTKFGYGLVKILREIIKGD